MHALLGIPSLDALAGHPVVGQSWEGFAVETLVAALRWPSLASFYRTSGGAEIDLVIDFGTGERRAIEVKRSRAPKVSRGFHSACEDVDPARTLVVHAGDDRFPISRSVEGVGLRELALELQSQS